MAAERYTAFGVSMYLCLLDGAGRAKTQGPKRATGAAETTAVVPLSELILGPVAIIMVIKCDNVIKCVTV